MEQIKSLEQISALIAANLKIGVRTNNFLAAPDYKAGIASGTLYCHSWQGGLLILRPKGGFMQLYFHLHDLSCPPDITIGETTVLELPARPGDAGADAALRFWTGLGFENCLRRIRMKRSGTSAAAAGSENSYIRHAVPSDLHQLAGLYHACFDPLTGCIPDTDRLSDLIELGCILCADAPDKSLCGFIEFTRSPSSEIRHLAVRKDMRGKKISKSLIQSYLKIVNPGRSLVWTGEKNKPAIGAYSACGYIPDGWSSAVLIKKT